MANFGAVPLFITVATLACFLPCPPFLSSAAPEELATEVCKNTTDFTFCRGAIYSDPRAATADPYELIDIVIRQAFNNASDTSDYIASTIKSGGGKFDNLKECEGDYKKATGKLTTMLDDVNSESYYGLDKLSLDVEGSVSACKTSLQGTSIIDERNENMLKLANICYVVSKLFESH